MGQVPDTNTFSLQDVVNVVGGSSLSAAFTNSVDSYFDSTYKGSKNNLYNFRNYTEALTRYYMMGTVGTSGRGQVSINNGSSWFDISVGAVGGTRSAVMQPGYYRNPYTINRNSWIVGGYSATTTSAFVTNTQNNWTTQNSSTFASKYYEFSVMCRDASYAYFGQWTYANYLRSTDWGKTWSEIALSPAPLNIVCSNNGQYVYGGNPNTVSTIYKSSSYGTSLTAGGTTTGQHKLVACDGTGQYVFAFYTGAHSTYFSTDYGANFTRLNSGASGGYAGISNDASLMFYTVNTSGDASNGIVFSTNKGSSWTRVAYPASWVTANAVWSDKYKRIWINQSNASKPIYKFNDAKNGWDLVYTMEVNTYGGGSASEFRDEYLICDVSRYVYRLTPAGVRTGPVYTGSTDRYAVNLF